MSMPASDTDLSTARDQAVRGLGQEVLSLLRAEAARDGRSSRATAGELTWLAEVLASEDGLDRFAAA